MVSVCRNVSAPGRRGDAEDWLETERSIVDLHRRGMMTWIPPRDRHGNTLTPKLTFGVFADRVCAPASQEGRSRDRGLDVA